LRILFILENYFPNIGGVETLFKFLAEELIRNDHHLTIVTNKHLKSLPFREESKNLTILRFPFKNRYLFTLLGCIPALYYAYKCDIIHTTSYNAGIPAFFASLISRKKVIITFHEVWGKLWFTLPFFNKANLCLHYLFENFLLKLNFDHFVAVSNYTYNCLVKNGIGESKIKRIYNGINYDNYPKRERKVNDKFKFIYFGRLGISKGLDILLEATKILNEKGKVFELLLVIPKGPKSLRKKIELLIESYRIGSKIIFKSELTKDNLIDEIVSANASVVPSYSEGFCFTAVESMALGTPIVSSGKGALREVVSGRYRVMANHNSIELAEQMENAINGNWIQKPIRKFHLKDTIDGYMELYDELSKNN